MGLRATRIASQLRRLSTGSEGRSGASTQIIFHVGILWRSSVCQSTSAKPGLVIKTGESQCITIDEDIHTLSSAQPHCVRIMKSNRTIVKIALSEQFRERSPLKYEVAVNISPMPIVPLYRFACVETT
jgi:hypothetical protein